MKKKSKQLADDIAQAREKGDLSENAEYHAAREEKGMVDAKIAFIQDQLSNSVIIDDSEINTDEVGFGTKVTMQDLDSNEKVVYSIVSEGEADLFEGKITVTSPIAVSLRGHKKGDTVDITIPAGTLRYKINKIEKA